MKKTICLGLAFLSFGYTAAMENVLYETNENVYKKEQSVQNPLPILISNINPNFMNKESTNSLSEVFLKQVYIIEEEYTKIPSTFFSKGVRQEWNNNLNLLKQLCEFLKGRVNAISDIYQQLVLITDDGFIVRSQLEISAREGELEKEKLLENFSQVLWQGREIAEYFYMLSLDHVKPAEIPYICESMDRSLGTIRSLFKEAKKPISEIEKKLNEILEGYQYMEYGKAMNKPSNIQKIEKVAEDRYLKTLLLAPFFDE